jgi:hypothetical protein
VLVAESFVDSQMFRGTCYKASGWELLGQTQGYGRSRQDYYVEHERPKQLWVRELVAGARTILRGRNLPEELAGIEEGLAPDCVVGVEEIGRMKAFFEQVPDWRKNHGTYRMSSLVALVLCATLSGARRGQRDLAAFAAGLTIKQLKALGLPRRGNPRKYLVPKETTFQRFLSKADNHAIEKALLGWQDRVLGKRQEDDNQVSVDGKELLNSQGVELVSAYCVKSGRWLGSELVEEKSNEIPAAQRLLLRAPIEGMLVTADAMHTQTKTARIITQEKGADYLFTVKGNQSTLADGIETLFNGIKTPFFHNKHATALKP